MTHKFILTSLASVLLAIPASALEVAITPGGLASQVTDHSITSLTVTGQMDARDFAFISKNLNDLETVDLGGATIVAYSNPDEPVFGQLTTYPANQLPTTSFFGKIKLTKLVLPSGVKSLAFASVAGCTSLTSIGLPSSLDSIGDYALSATGLKGLILPTYLRVLGEGALSRCEVLESVNMPAGLIGKKAFQADEKLNSVKLGNVTAIGDAAFSGCASLKSLTLSSPALLTSIGSEAFVESGITTLDLSAMTSLKSLGSFALAGTGITTVSLPDGIKELGEGAFYYMKGITSLVLPSSVKQIPNYLLAGTNVQNKDVFDDNVTSLGDYALYNLSAYETFILPYGVEHIGTKAMAGMTGLKTLTSRNPVPAELGDSVWAGVNQPTVELLGGSDDYKTADQWKDFKAYHAYLLGDVNCNGKVDVGDVTALVGHLVGDFDPNDPYNPDAADVLTDGKLDVGDVTELVNLILAQSTIIVKKAPAPSTNDAVTLPDIDIKPGQTVELPINLNNASSYAGMQLDITLPDGLEFVEQSQQGAERGKKLNWLTSTLDGGQVRIIAFSLSNVNVEAGEGSVGSILVRATKQLPAQSTIQVDGIVLADAHGNTSFAAPAQSQVNNTTGITDAATEAAAKVWAADGLLVIESQEACAAQLVNVSGQVSTLLVQPGHNEYDGLSAGIYVVRVAGKSHKVVIK